MVLVSSLHLASPHTKFNSWVVVFVLRHIRIRGWLCVRLRAWVRQVNIWGQVGVSTWKCLMSVLQSVGKRSHSVHAESFFLTVRVALEGDNVRDWDETLSTDLVGWERALKDHRHKQLSLIHCQWMVLDVVIWTQRLWWWCFHQNWQQFIVLL